MIRDTGAATRAGYWTWITEFTSGQCDSVDGCAYPGTWSGRGDGSFVTSTVGTRLGSGSSGAGGIECVSRVDTRDMG